MIIISLGKRKKKTDKIEEDKSSSGASTISTSSLKNIIDKLKRERNRSSTRKNYYCVWKKFNEFFIKLDEKPSSWEERLTLFVGYLIENNCKSGMVRSYVSAVKAVLKDDGEEINENTFLLNSLTRACRITNDHVRTRLPIRKGLLKELVIEIDNVYNVKQMQPYLAKLFKALFVTAYFGLFRLGELTQSEHVVKAADVHIGRNKKKLMFVLHSSKTHGKDSKPQIIKIYSSDIQITGDRKGSEKMESSIICPFEILKQYVTVRRTRSSENEQFFVFHDRSPVMP